MRLTIDLTNEEVSAILHLTWRYGSTDGMVQVDERERAALLRLVRIFMLNDVSFENISSISAKIRESITRELISDIDGFIRDGIFPAPSNVANTCSHVSSIPVATPNRSRNMNMALDAIEDVIRQDNNQ